MAVTLITNRKHYIGLSTDTKPDTTVGSTFLEQNTGVKFIYNGTDWVEDLTMIYALSQVL